MNIFCIKQIFLHKFAENIQYLCRIGLIFVLLSYMRLFNRLLNEEVFRTIHERRSADFYAGIHRFAAAADYFQKFKELDSAAVRRSGAHAFTGC